MPSGDVKKRNARPAVDRVLDRTVMERRRRHAAWMLQRRRDLGQIA